MDLKNVLFPQTDGVLKCGEEQTGLFVSAPSASNLEMSKVRLKMKNSKVYILVHQSSVNTATLTCFKKKFDFR